MKPMSSVKRTVYFTIFVVLFIVCIPVIVMYSMGYSLSDAFSVIERGGVYVYVDEPGTRIYLDGEVKRTTGMFQREYFTQKLRPEEYFVLVSNDKFWPWAKYVDVKPKKVAALYPLLVPRDMEILEIPRYVPAATSSPRVVSRDYLRAEQLFVPESSAPSITLAMSPEITPEDKGIVRRKIKVWVNGSSIYTRWLGTNDAAAPTYFCKYRECDEPLLVMSLKSEPRNIDFYPGRNDAIIFSADSGVYVSEIDAGRYQNFYPIFQGKSPNFKLQGSTLYVKDGDFLGVINL